MAQSASVEFLRKGNNVRVNAVAPGFMKTELIPGSYIAQAQAAVPEYFGDPVCKYYLCKVDLVYTDRTYCRHCQRRAVPGFRYDFQLKLDRTGLINGLEDEAQFVNGETHIVDNSLVNGVRADKLFK